MRGAGGVSGDGLTHGNGGGLRLAGGVFALGDIKGTEKGHEETGKGIGKGIESLVIDSKGTYWGLLRDISRFDG